MAIDTSDWERPLLSLAHEARNGQDMNPATQAVDGQELSLAYEYCEAITSIHSRSFFMASRFLPEVKRRSIRALYAFCRRTDDLVDKAIETRRNAKILRASLEAWKTRSLTPASDFSDPIISAWTDARRRFGIPQRYAEQLFQGIARDIEFKRFETFADLSMYCYGVASTVGLMAMHVVGFSGVEAIPYAIKLGVALQLTNILRDVGEDWRAGRLYLPLDEIVCFGVKLEDVAMGRVNERWRGFMRFQIKRNRRLYEEALPGIALLHSDGHFAISTAAELYRAILVEIEANDYDVFSRRAHVGILGKLKRLPSIWWRSKNLASPGLGFQTQ